MSRHGLLNLGLLVLFAVLLALNLVLGADPGRRNVEFLPEMVDSVPYDAYAPNPVFADGKTLQRPPEGTIPRGLVPFHYGTGDEEAARAGRELWNPLVAPAELGPAPAVGPEDPDADLVLSIYEESRAAAAADLARGEEVYARYCQVCHGAGGDGDGPVAKRGFPAPPSLMARKAREMPDGQMFHLVTRGGENMPSYAAQVGRADRWRSILWVRELQLRGPVLEDPEPAPAQPAGPAPGDAPVTAAETLPDDAPAAPAAEEVTAP